ncbi:MAG: YvcK family protein [Chloroflexi bacterium]|nr:YvcK family protein [Chloroflexota bacterium]
MPAQRESRVVVIGGGSGSAVLLKSLKKHTSNITAIISMFDSGGSTGILREEFGYPPLGDIRQCLLALSGDDQKADALRSAFEFRFSSSSSLRGHSVGNLILAALTSALDTGVTGAISELSRMLDITGRVVPVTLQDAQLCAELANGVVVVGESKIDQRGEETPPIKRVFLDRHVEANPDALDAIAEADVVVLGPGDLYTSVVPNLLADGVCEALRETRASVAYVCNVMTKLGETSGYDAARFTGTIHTYLGGLKLDYAVVNTQSIPEDVQAHYVTEGAHPVDPDGDEILEFAQHVVRDLLLNLGPPVRHDGEKLAELVLRLAERTSRAREARNLSQGTA